MNENGATSDARGPDPLFRSSKSSPINETAVASSTVNSPTISGLRLSSSNCCSPSIGAVCVGTANMGLGEHTPMASEGKAAPNDNGDLKDNGAPKDPQQDHGTKDSHDGLTDITPSYEHDELYDDPYPRKPPIKVIPIKHTCKPGVCFPLDGPTYGVRVFSDGKLCRESNCPPPPQPPPRDGPGNMDQLPILAGERQGLELKNAPKADAPRSNSKTPTMAVAQQSIGPKSAKKQERRQLQSHQKKADELIEKLITLDIEDMIDGMSKQHPFPVTSPVPETIQLRLGSSCYMWWALDDYLNQVCQVRSKINDTAQKLDDAQHKNLAFAKSVETARHLWFQEKAASKKALENVVQACFDDVSFKEKNIARGLRSIPHTYQEADYSRERLERKFPSIYANLLEHDDLVSRMKELARREEQIALENSKSASKHSPVWHDLRLNYVRFKKSVIFGYLHRLIEKWTRNGGAVPLEILLPNDLINLCAMDSKLRKKMEITIAKLQKLQGERRKEQRADSDVKLSDDPLVADLRKRWIALANFVNNCDMPEAINDYLDIAQKLINFKQGLPLPEWDFLALPNMCDTFVMVDPQLEESLQSLRLIANMHREEFPAEEGYIQPANFEKDDSDDFVTTSESEEFDENFDQLVDAMHKRGDERGGLETDMARMDNKSAASEIPSGIPQFDGPASPGPERRRDKAYKDPSPSATSSSSSKRKPSSGSSGGESNGGSKDNKRVVKKPRAGNGYPKGG